MASDASRQVGLNSSKAILRPNMIQEATTGEYIVTRQKSSSIGSGVRFKSINTKIPPPIDDALSSPSSKNRPVTAGNQRFRTVKNNRRQTLQMNSMHNSYTHLPRMLERDDSNQKANLNEICSSDLKKSHGILHREDNQLRKNLHNVRQQRLKNQMQKHSAERGSIRHSNQTHASATMTQQKATNAILKPRL